MLANRDMAVEAAKKMVSMQFNLADGLSGMDIGNAGYLYETDSSNEFENNLVEIEGTYAGAGKESGTVLLKSENKKNTLVMVKETVYSRSITSNKSIATGEKLYVIAVKAEGCSVYVPVVVLRDSEKEYFMMVKSLYGRTIAIKDFYKLSVEEQESIMVQTKTGHHKRYSSGEELFTTKKNQMLRYALTEETYPPDTQHVIETMFRSSGVKNKAELRQKYIFAISPVYKDRIPVTEKSFNILKKRFYKMNGPKQQLKDILLATERAEKKGCKLLFVGAPGVGKTSLMMAIADVMNIPFECIPLNGLSCPLEIEGLDPSYDNADAGAIVRAFAAHGTSQMIIGLDEFDKMNRETREGDPMSVFLRLFLGDHYDKFLQCTIKTDNTVFIATANSIEDIPEPIRNRFDAIVYFDEYSRKDKLELAKCHIIPEVLQNYNISTENIRFENRAIESIIANYCEDDGARDLKHNIERIVRRVIASGLTESQKVVTEEYVENVLDELVKETPGLYFNKHRENYTEPVSQEIKKCIAASQKASFHNTDRYGTEKMRQKLGYLLACRKEEKTYLDEFDPLVLYNTLHKSLFGMDNVIDQITRFYYTEYLQGGSGLNKNLALCGGYGTGKTSIVKYIADAIGYQYVKISLNGVDDIKELRGFSQTYAGSEPGRFIKGIKEAGSTRIVLQLDELDKLNSKYATAILDLLDREFTDSFLNVPVDFSDAIFVATVNNWGDVPAVLRDRFLVLNVDGYTRTEKRKIVSDYIVPKLEKSYADSGVTIAFDDGAKELLLKTYANSFGVRDAEKAVQLICSGKLVDQAAEKDSMRVIINREDVKKYLGVEPVPRGNFPEEAIPGISKALSVCNGGITGSTFAVETVLTEGEECLEVTGLPKETVMDSVKIAVTYIKKRYPTFLKEKEIHIHFGEGAITKDGPSAGVAVFTSILSAAVNKTIMDKKAYDIAYTGEISLTGGIFAVGSIFEKIQAACDSGCSKVFIPMQNYERLDEQRLEEFACDVIPVKHLSEVVAAIYPEL